MSRIIAGAVLLVGSFFLIHPPLRIFAAVVVPKAPIISVLAAPCGGFTDLTYSLTPNATSYRVTRGDSATGIYADITDQTLPIVDNPGQGTFYYKVEAQNNGSVIATSLAKAIKSSAPCASPVLTSTVAACGGNVALSWKAPTTYIVSGYDIYRSTTAAGTYAKVNSSAVSGLSYVDTPGQGNFYYKLQPVSQGDTTQSVAKLIQASLACPAVVPSVPPAAPSGLFGGSIACGSDTVNFSWQSSIGAKGYVISKKNSSGEIVSIATTSQTSFTGNGSNGGPGDYYVAAFNDAGASSQSIVRINAIACTPASPLPANKFTISCRADPATVAIGQSFDWIATSSVAASYQWLFVGQQNPSGATLHDNGYTSVGTRTGQVTAYRSGIALGTASCGVTVTAGSIVKPPVTPPASKVPSTPTSLQAVTSDTCGGYTDISWNASKDTVNPPLGYTIYRSSTSSGIPRLIASTSAATLKYQDHTSEGVVYYYIVAAFNSSGVSIWTSPVSASASIACQPIDTTGSDPVDGNQLPPSPPPPPPPVYPCTSGQMVSLVDTCVPQSNTQDFVKPDYLSKANWSCDQYGDPRECPYYDDGSDGLGSFIATVALPSSVATNGKPTKLSDLLTSSENTDSAIRGDLFVILIKDGKFSSGNSPQDAQWLYLYSTEKFPTLPQTILDQFGAGDLVKVKVIINGKEIEVWGFNDQPTDDPMGFKWEFLGLPFPDKTANPNEKDQDPVPRQKYLGLTILDLLNLSYRIKELKVVVKRNGVIATSSVMAGSDHEKNLPAGFGFSLDSSIVSGLYPNANDAYINYNDPAVTNNLSADKLPSDLAMYMADPEKIVKPGEPIKYYPRFYFSFFYNGRQTETLFEPNTNPDHATDRVSSFIPVEVKTDDGGERLVLQDKKNKGLPQKGAVAVVFDDHSIGSLAVATNDPGASYEIDLTPVYYSYAGLYDEKTGDVDLGAGSVSEVPASQDFFARVMAYVTDLFHNASAGMAAMLGFWIK